MAYSIPNFWSQNTGYTNLLAQNQARFQNQVTEQRETKRQQRIYKQRADQKFLDTLSKEFNAADSLKAEFEDYAVNAREELLDYMAKAMTYDLDENGEITDKRKIQRLFSEPGLSDREMLLIRKKVDGYTKTMDQMKGAETQLRDSINKFDPDKHDYDAFMTGRTEIEASGKPSKYPLLVLKDKDPSFLRGMKGKETGKSTVKGDGVTSSRRNRTSEEERLFIYRDALMNDAAFQKYSINEMLENMGYPDDFVSGMNEAGVRINRPTDFLQAYGVTSEDLKEFESSYGGIIPSSLVQAAMTYGEKVKKYQDDVDSLEIGATTTFNKDEAGVGQKTRTYVAGDFKLDDFVDLGTASTEKKRYEGKLPKGTMRFKRDGKTKELSKSFPERNQRIVYDKAGYDKKAGYIVLYNKPKKDEPVYEYIVPLRGNEWMIEENDSNIEQTELTENYFD